MINKQETHLKEWQGQEEAAEQMLPLVGQLYRERNIVSTVYGRSLVHSTTIDILKAHRFARLILEEELSIHKTLPVIEALSQLDLAPARIDIGKLAVGFAKQQTVGSLSEYVSHELASINTGRRNVLDEPQDIVLYGFGRIGRLLARLLIEKSGSGEKLRLRAAVVRKGSPDDLIKRASLLRRDSVHGHFNGIITVDEEENAIIANGNMIRIIYADAPESVDYTSYGINNAILIDNTGKWRDREGLSRHLQAKGVAKVLLTAPGKGDIPNVVAGVNHELITGAEQILSAASCTTNAIVPVLKAVHDRFGILNGHVETCHSYTNDQNLIDNYHKGARRGRSAVLNMVITETGAAKAVAQSHSRARRQADRQRHPGADPQRFTGNSQPGTGSGDQRQRAEPLHTRYRAELSTAEPDRLHHLTRSGLQRFCRFTSRRGGGFAGHHRAGQPLCAVRLV